MGLVQQAHNTGPFDVIFLKIKTNPLFVDRSCTYYHNFLIIKAVMKLGFRRKIIDYLSHFRFVM